VDPVTVVVMAPILGRDLAYVADVDPRITVIDANHLVSGPQVDDDERSALLAGADVVVVGAPVPARVAEFAPHLRWAHHTQAGVSNLHSSDLWTAPIRLTSSRGTVAPTAIAEYAIGGAFHFARGAYDGTRQKYAGEFTRTGYQMRMLAGSTIGVLGLGGIGNEVARLAKALGMRVVATRRSVTDAQHDVGHADLVLPADGTIEVAAQSDFLIICAQLTPQTRHLVNAEVLAAMPAGAVLINVGRGEQVDEDALVRALTDGTIRGAVLDVYDGELAGRPPRRELLDLPNVLLTPHQSSIGSDFAVEGRLLVQDNLRRFIAGQPLVNEVDRERGY
jgi:phosphoglycerate dehydrogenase-like enzyme